MKITVSAEGFQTITVDWPPLGPPGRTYENNMATFVSLSDFNIQAAALTRISPVSIAGRFGMLHLTLPGDNHIFGSVDAERCDTAATTQWLRWNEGDDVWLHH